MKFSIAVLFILLAAVSAQADEYLLTTNVRDIRLLQINAGKAILRGSGDSRAEAVVGDQIGRERAKIVKVEGMSITVQMETQLITLLMRTGITSPGR
ncbi:MAG: hypothetical protein M0042_12095 [Nitrospiraceae bacterium]|nr:hypothetical protein [Nitrospiraceae bacterium]